MTRTRYDAVVVGGGHNGLVAAGYLARAGLSVLVLERDAELGGATRSSRIFPGVDARLSRYSYLVSLLPRAIIDDLGLQFSTRRRSTASCTSWTERGQARALLLSNVDVERSRASMESLGGGTEWRGYRRLLELERAFAARVWPSLLTPLRHRREWERVMQSPDEREAWRSLVERPLADLIERHLQNDVVRGKVMTDAKIGLMTTSSDETLLQNRCFILHVIGQGTGEWQVPVGGMGALVQALTTAAREAGARLLTDSPVQAIHAGTPRHSVVYRHGDREQEVEASRVLINAGPQVLAALLGREYRPACADEGSVCKMNVLLRKLPRLKAGVDPREAFAGTFHLNQEYRHMERTYRQAASGEIPERPPVEIYCHTLTDASILGPELRVAGYHTITMFGLDMPYRLFEPDNETAKEIVLARYLASLDGVLSEPLQECMARDSNGQPCIEIKSPIDLERELALNRGNIFHQAPSWFFADDSVAAGTWGVETDVERVYCCGSSAIRGGAVSGIPGHNAARCIFEELDIGGKL